MKTRSARPASDEGTIPIGNTTEEFASNQGRAGDVGQVVRAAKSSRLMMRSCVRAIRRRRVESRKV